MARDPEGSKVARLIRRFDQRHAAQERLSARRSNSTMLSIFGIVVMVGAIVVLLYVAFR